MNHEIRRLVNDGILISWLMNLSLYNSIGELNKIYFITLIDQIQIPEKCALPPIIIMKVDSISSPIFPGSQPPFKNGCSFWKMINPY